MPKLEIKPVRVKDMVSAKKTYCLLCAGKNEQGLKRTTLVYPKLGKRDEIVEDKYGNVFLILIDGARMDYEEISKTKEGEKFQMKITIDNVCDACGEEGCREPCAKWYDCLEGKPVDFGFIKKENDNDEN